MVPFCPFYFRVPLLKTNNKEKGTLIIMGLLRNLGSKASKVCRGIEDWGFKDGLHVKAGPKALRQPQPDISGTHFRS